MKRHQIFYKGDCACACAAPVAMPAQIPAESEMEKQLKQQQYDFGQKLVPSSDRLLQFGNRALDNQINVNYDKLWSEAQPALDSQKGLMQKLQGEYDTGTQALARGEVNPLYAQARMKAMQGGIDKTVGSNMQKMYRKGLIGGTDMRNWQDTLNANVAQQMNAGFGEDIKTQQGLLDSRMTGMGALSDAVNKGAMNPIANATTAQNAALNPAMQYFGASIGNMQPSNAQLGTLADQRYSLASPNQWYTPPTVVSSCFPAGTMINTPDGEKDITDIKVDDEVYTLDEEIVYVTAVMKPRMSKIVKLTTDKGIIRCTLSQPFFDKDFQEILTKDLVLGHMIVDSKGMATVLGIKPDGEELVYDFSTESGDYMANGFLASDWGE